LRKALSLLAAASVALAGCSSGNRGPEPSQAEDSAGAPDVSPTAAPGVAFTYSYLFDLPDEAIGRVQESHAARCEALGVARCRITGLKYNVSDTKAVWASLDLKLAPDIARQFGKDAEGDVTKADGKLRETEFTGEDTTPATTAANRQRSAAEQQIAEVERRLRAATSEEERAGLQAQLSELRAQAAGAQSSLESQQEMLAGTPMHFSYAGRGGIAGFQSNPIRDAGRSLVDSVVTMVTVLLQMLAYLLPWALLLAAIVWLFRTRAGRSVVNFLRPRERPLDGE